MSDNATIVPRPPILETLPAYHGALDYVELERLGLQPEAILDFSVNSNPYGPSPQVKQAIAQVPLDRYPDREALELRRALGQRLGISPDQFVAGNGTAELLWLAAFAFLQPGDPVLVIGPTFGEYSRLASLMGARLKTWQASAAHDFALDCEAVARQLDGFQPKITFLCNPNNPTGGVIPLEIIETWVKTYPETLFVIDEAYLAFAADVRSALEVEANNILVLRSMTKDYALAGLRLGYAVGHNRTAIMALAQVRPAWNVNAFAQAAGVAALTDEAHQRRSLAALVRAKEALVKDLQTLGLPPVPSATHFFLVRVGSGASFRQALLSLGILVRDCASFGLPAYMRVATRLPEENDRLLAAIRALGANSGLAGQIKEIPISGGAR